MWGNCKRESLWRFFEEASAIGGWPHDSESPAVAVAGTVRHNSGGCPYKEINNSQFQ